MRTFQFDLDSVEVGGFPRLRVPARWNCGMSAAVSDSIVAFACVIGAVGRDAAGLRVLRVLAQQVGSHRCVTEMAPVHWLFRTIGIRQ